MPPKRLCIFNEKLQNDFPFIKKLKSTDDFNVQCTTCRGTFSVSHGGRSDINDHLKMQKHKLATRSSVQFGKVSNYFSGLVRTENDFLLAACEATFVYHTIIHNHSFRSMSCISELIRQCLNDKKFTCAKIKTREIVVSVICPYIVDNTLKELSSANYVSVLIKSSNHKAIKLVPVVVRYFFPHVGVINKILEFSNLPGETSDLITFKIIDIITNFELKQKIIALLADITNTNFAGYNRKGKNNVHTKLQTELKKDIFVLGCNVHILHNAIQIAQIIDIDQIVLFNVIGK
jgi:hypothetical protein